MQGVVCAACLRYLHGIHSFGTRPHPNWGTQLPLGQAGPSITPENWYVGETLADLQLQLFAMDILAESSHIPPGSYQGVL